MNLERETKAIDNQHFKVIRERLMSDLLIEMENEIMGIKNYTKQELKDSLKTMDIIQLSFTIGKSIEWIENKIKDRPKREIIKAKEYKGGMAIPIQVEHILFRDDIISILYCRCEIYGDILPLSREDTYKMIRTQLSTSEGYEFDLENEELVGRVSERVDILFPELKENVSVQVNKANESSQ